MAASSSSTKPLPLAATAFTKRTERRVLGHVRKHAVLRPGERMIAAVSGGPDSAALLLILARLRARLQIQIIVAHFNHMLRGQDEATADLAFVHSLASTLNLPLVHGSGDVRGRAHRNHESLEDAARRLRYAFFAEEAALAGASCAATGHTLDDQAETVLLHLIRGAGLAGLAGMRPRSSWPFDAGPDLARPLLCLSREETARYCAESGVEPRQDPTNLLPAATRNRIRHTVLPGLRGLNPRIADALGRLSQSVAEDADYLDEAARYSFADVVSARSGGVSFDRRRLLALPPAIAARCIRLAIAEVRGSALDIEAVHVQALLDALKQPAGNYSLPAGLTATTTSRALIIQAGEAPRARPIVQAPLSVPGRTMAGFWTISAEIVPPPADLRTPACEAYVDADRTGLDLTVRSRRPGDRLRPLGLGGDKKLQDILVDAKVPAAERDGVPLVCGPDGIIWVAGHCIDEHYALNIDSRRAIHLIAALTITNNYALTTLNSQLSTQN